jgi:hypothetical protein
MEVKIFPTIPHEWVNRRGKSYETQFIYLGFSRYDTHQKVISKFTTDTDRITYSETPCTNTVFSRGYYTEHATVTVYSRSLLCPATATDRFNLTNDNRTFRGKNGCFNNHGYNAVDCEVECFFFLSGLV